MQFAIIFVRSGAAAARNDPGAARVGSVAVAGSPERVETSRQPGTRRNKRSGPAQQKS